MRKLILAALLSLFWLLPVTAYAQTTIFSATLGGGNSGNGGWSLRNQIPTTGNSLGKISVTISSPAAGGLQADHVSYCIVATMPNCAAPPVELTFSGGHGFNIPANSSAISDFVTFTPTGTNVMVIIDVTAATSGDIGFDTSSAGTGVPWIAGGTASWNVQSPSGFSAGSAGQDYGVILIQTEASGSRPTPTLAITGAGS